MKHFLVFLLVLAFHTVFLSAQQYHRLDGMWRFGLDEKNVGISEQWYRQNLSNGIAIPGTTDEAQYGDQTVGADFGILTRTYKYYGPAWYQTDITIPADWKGKRIFLHLERVMWESKVYVDEQEMSTYDALGSSHMHDLGHLSVGKHRLTIRVNNDMIHNIGDKGHLYTEYTQSIWNGIVGKVELIAKHDIRLDNPQVYTKISPTSLQIVDTLINEGKKTVNVSIQYDLYDFKTKDKVFSASKQLRLDGERTVLNMQDNMPADVKLWDDVHPNLYVLDMQIVAQDGRVVDTKKIEVGFREVTASKSKIWVNGKPVFFRGNLDCVHFPITGYPATDVEEWERIFRIYKSYGLNHVRFHSWCPPAAAFQAANRLGIYMQPEVIWLDWWMAVDNPGREEMNTQGRPQGLGHNPSADAFVKKEIHRMFATYGNHPAFTTMSIGNELGNSDFDTMESWLKPYQEKDNRRLYSVSSARRVTDMDQFVATHNLDKIGATRGIKGAHTDWDFESVYRQSNIPVIAHEIGQWPVYPKWDEIKKYTGVLKARNFEEFMETARKNKIVEQNAAFVAASGALNQIMYKYEIESFLRTPSCAGIQLLSMQDYQGQGEALIGWLDVFYDSKGITTPEKFRTHHDTTVMLLRMPKYVWKSDEAFQAKVQIAHYGTTSIQDAVYWKLKDQEGRLVDGGRFAGRTFATGSADIIGNIQTALSSIKKATKLTVEVGLETRANNNSWDIWVYPDVKTADGEVYIADRFDTQAQQVLAKGGKVLLQASALGNAATSDLISYYPLYWSLTFFPGQGKNTIGMLVNDKHAAFMDFPTEFHSDWQWQSIYKNAKGFYINDFPAAYRPLAQPIDDFHRNNKLASIFELKVGEGRLLVSGFDLSDVHNPVAQQLKSSLLHYMQSDRFSPEYEHSLDSLKKMLIYIEPLKSVIPAEFAKALLYVEAGKMLKATNQNIDWQLQMDRAEAKKGATYQVMCDGVWKDEVSSAWQGKQVDVQFKVPQGMIGSLYIFFHDWNGNGREGDITFEGRDYTIGKHDKEGVWIKLHVMREDSNDGVLKFRAKVSKGPNVMISKLALVEDVE